jgi:IS30 family transposase
MTRGGVPVSRALRRVFWLELRSSGDTAAASAAAGVSVRSGQFWVRQAGGMPDVSLVEPSGRFLSPHEREEIAVAWAAGSSAREIAAVLGRSASTISRELARNRADDGRYKPLVAQARAEARARRPKESKIAAGPRLRAWLEDKLENERWSPQQLSARLRVDFPHDEQMRISHEAIYRSLYVQGRGHLRQDLTSALRTGRAARRPLAVTRAKATARYPLPAEVMISERPAEVTDRAVPGHWEGDLITGTKNQSAIGTLVERTTRFVMLLHLPDGHGAQQVATAMRTKITTLPVHLRKTLTWDQGREMTPMATLQIVEGLDLYFCDPHSPWQRGTNENTNGLLRQYFPKGTDLSVHSAEHLDQVARSLNGRPRQTLNWANPAEALNRLLLAEQPATGATTT